MDKINFQTDRSFCYKGTVVKKLTKLKQLSHERSYGDQQRGKTESHRAEWRRPDGTADRHRDARVVHIGPLTLKKSQALSWADVIETKIRINPTWWSVELFDFNVDPLTGFDTTTALKHSFFSFLSVNFFAELCLRPEFLFKIKSALFTRIS